jgi:hypothetical protein
MDVGHATRITYRSEVTGQRYGGSYERIDAGASRFLTSDL